MNIILASGSPRRCELLKSAQLDFNMMSVDIDEASYSDELPVDYIQRMVATKALAAVDQLHNIQKNKLDNMNISKPITILTADTIGVLPDCKTILVKPIDYQHACHMWQQMSNNTHQVWTAVQVTKVQRLPVDDGDDCNDASLIVISQQQIIERTEVTFVPLTPKMMDNYWHSGEPADKAGGYAIQGLAAAWVTSIQGSYTNVVGLPLAQTLALLAKMNAECSIE